MTSPNTTSQQAETRQENARLRRHLSPRALALDTSLPREERTALLVERAQYARQQQVATGEGMPGEGGTELAAIESALELLGGVPKAAMSTRAGTSSAMPHFPEQSDACARNPGAPPDARGGGLPCSRARWSRSVLPLAVTLAAGGLAVMTLRSGLSTPIMYPLAGALILATLVGAAVLCLYLMARGGL